MTTQLQTSVDAHCHPVANTGAMIGVFDSGLCGLTVLRELTRRFPHADFVYLADHAHVPYGNRSSDEIVELT